MDPSKLKDETRAAFVNRAVLYYYLFDEMRKEFGAERAGKAFARAVRRRGVDSGAKYAEAARESDFARLGETFVRTQPCEGELFQPELVEVTAEGCVITMSSCPLVDAWRELGLDDDEVALMCRMASEIDFATFESIGLELEMDDKIGEGAQSCRLVIRKPKA